MAYKQHFSKFLSAFIITVFLLGILPAAPARAGTITVDTLTPGLSSDGFCSLHEAIYSARDNVSWFDCPAGDGDDLIVFSVSGTISMAGFLPPYTGTSETITIDGGNNITLDGNWANPIWRVNSGTAILQNITLTDDNVGLLMEGSASLTLNNVNIDNINYGVQATTSGDINVADSTFSNGFRGIVDILGDSLIVTNSTFTGLSGLGGSWGIYVGSSVTLNVSGSTFSNNTSDNFGAGITVDGTATISNCTFSNNSSVSATNLVGGAAVSNNGTTTIVDSIFESNSASGGSFGYGGAVYNSVGTITIENSLFNGNSAAGPLGGRGGAIYLSGGSATLANLTIVGNSADYGSAIYIPNYSWSPIAWSMRNSTIFANSSLSGSSVQCISATGCSNLDNTIIAEESSGTNCINVSGIPATNISTDSSCSGATIVALADLQLGSLGDYGGPTPTIPLLLGSPAINSGNNATCLSTDQRGVTRPQGTTCDVGAYEVLAIYLPDTGFAPDVITDLPAQPPESEYQGLGGIWMEIPKLDVMEMVVGVPPAQQGWDLTWLGSNIGWLQGTAFPTWPGNTALTAHSYTANGLPGPFQGLEKLRWGDRISIYAYGQKYTYEVRSVSFVYPDNTHHLTKHEEYDWITLVTCYGYDDLADSYRWRVVARAVLVEVQ